MHRTPSILFALAASVLTFCITDAARAQDIKQSSKIARLEKRMSGLWLKLPVTANGDAREELTNAQHDQYIAHTPELEQSEKREDDVFSELVSLTTGRVRNDLVASQRRWLLKERTRLAKLIAGKISIPMAEAYLLSTEERTRRLSVYCAQLKQAPTPMSVVGNVEFVNGEDGSTWGLRVDQFWLPFTLTVVGNPNNPRMEQVLRAAYESGRPVSVVGILNGVSSFDTTTIGVRDAGAGDSPPLPPPSSSRPQKQKPLGEGTVPKTIPLPPGADDRL